jgi:Ni,Fe-hydrogenase III large subunit
MSKSNTTETRQKINENSFNVKLEVERIDENKRRQPREIFSELERIKSQLLALHTAERSTPIDSTRRYCLQGVLL